MPASPVVVLGMHRSGTSTAAAALGHLGLNLGRSLAAADQWNPKGYFEDREVVTFDDALLARVGRRWDSPLPPAAAECAELEPRAAAAAELLGRCFPGPGPWAVKDPRLSLLWPFWQGVFTGIGLAPRCLVTLRHPAEVARSLARRDGIGPTRAAWLWLTHMAGALEAARSMANSRFVAFDDLVRDPRAACTGIGAWLGVHPAGQAIDAFATDFIDPSLVRAAAVEPSAIPPLVAEAHEALRQAVAEGRPPHDVAVGTAWREVLARFQGDILPDLRRVQAFFAADRQASAIEDRVVALTAGLAEAEGLAGARLDEVRQVSAALARSEQLAAARLQEASRLDAQLRDTAAALAKAEDLAVARLAESRRLAAALEETAAALAAAQDRADELAGRLVALGSKQEEHRLQAIRAEAGRVDAVLAGLEGVAVGSEPTGVLAALRAAEKLAWDRLAELEAAASRERRLNAALADAERLAAARLRDAESLDGALARTAAGLAASEQLARDRLGALELADRRLADTTAALARAEQLAVERLATIEDLARQPASSPPRRQGEIGAEES